MEKIETDSGVRHHRYKRCTPQEADACAFVFSGVEKMEKYYYKMPAVADDEVEGRVLFAGICHSDIHLGNSHWSDVTYPIACGHETVAEVTKMGKNVKNFKVGDKFLVGCYRNNCGRCVPCKETHDNMCIGMAGDRFTYGDNFWGGHSTHIQVPEHWCFKAPDGLKLESAAPLMCAGVTTFNPLQRFGKPGYKIGIIGIGGLGHLAVQISHKMGMEVTAFAHNLDCEAEIKKLGAAKVVDWFKTDLPSQFENQYDLILNTLPVGIHTEKLQNFFAVLRPLGTFIQVGLPHRCTKLEIFPSQVVSKSLSFSGSLIGSHKVTEDMLEFMTKHKIEAQCEHFDFEDFTKAVDKLVHGKPHFRCVIDTHKFKIK